MTASSRQKLDTLSGGNAIVQSATICARVAGRYRDAMTVAAVHIGAQDDVGRFRQLDLTDQIFFLRLAGVRAAIDGLILDRADTRAAGDWHRSISQPLSALRDGRKLEGWRNAGADFRLLLCADFPYCLSVWSGETDAPGWQETQDLRILFERHMQHTVGAEICAPAAATSDEVRRADRCLQYLDAVSPAILADIGYNVRQLVKIDYRRLRETPSGEYREIGQSVSTHAIAGACFLSPYALSHDEICAESIYHEALHKKLSNTLVAWDILSTHYDWTQAPKFLSHWNVHTDWNANLWEFDRALYALHVYVHLALLYATLLEENDFRLFSRPWCEERTATARARAAWIYDWITGLQAVMGRDGQKLIAQLGACIGKAQLETA